MISLNPFWECRDAILKVKFRKKLLTLHGSVLKIETSSVYFAPLQGGVLKISKRRIEEALLFDNAAKETLKWLKHNKVIWRYLKEYGRYPHFLPLTLYG